MALLKLAWHTWWEEYLPARLNDEIRVGTSKEQGVRLGCRTPAPPEVIQKMMLKAQELDPPIAPITGADGKEYYRVGTETPPTDTPERR